MRRQGRSHQGGRRIVRDPQREGPSAERVSNGDRLGQRSRRRRAGQRRRGPDGRADRRGRAARRWQVYEKAATVGGTTAVSGGIVWIPAHDRSPDGELTVADAMRYLEAQSLGVMDRELVETFVHTGPAMLDFVEAAQRAAVRDRRGVPGLQARAAGRAADGRPFAERQAVRPGPARRMERPDHVVSRRLQQCRHRRRDAGADPRRRRRRGR